MPSGGLFGDGTFGSDTFGGLTAGASGITYSVEVAFSTASPLTDPVSWTDVTAYFQSFTIHRGKSHELQRTQAGYADIDLINLDRRFDPTYTSSPYYPNILPMKQIRVRATYSSVTYELFRGFVEDWGQDWGNVTQANAGEATCTLHAVDAFKVLSLPELRSYSTEVLADNPLGYWPLNDPAGTRSVAFQGSVGNTLEDLYVHQDITLGVAGPIAHGGSTAAEWATTATSLRVLPVNAQTDFRANGDCSYEAWVYSIANPGSARDIIAADITGAIPAQLGIDSTGHITSGHETQGGELQSFASASTFSTGAWTHLVIVVRSRVVELWKNGVLETLGTLSRDPVGTGSDVLLGPPTAWNVRLAHVAIYPTALTPSRIAAHYDARQIDALQAQPSGTALGAILDWVGWPAGLRTIDTGISMVAATPNGSALGLMQQIGEDTERGILLVTPDGAVTFIARDTLEKRVTSSATFGDSGADQPYMNLRLRYDDQDIYSEVGVSSPAAAAVVSDSTAETTYGPRTLSVSTLSTTENEVTDIANGLLSRYRAAAVRPETMELQGVGSLTQQLTRAIGDRVLLHRHPSGGGTQISVDALIEGITHHTDPRLAGRLMTTFSLSPLLAPTTFWILADSTYGVLDSTTRLGW